MVKHISCLFLLPMIFLFPLSCTFYPVITIPVFLINKQDLLLLCFVTYTLAISLAASPFFGLGFPPFDLRQLRRGNPPLMSCLPIISLKSRTVIAVGKSGIFVIIRGSVLDSVLLLFLLHGEL